MAYMGTLTYHTAWREYQWDVINSYWAPMFNMTKTLNTLNLPDTVNIQGFDSLLNSWVPQSMYVMHYNSFNDPDKLYDYEYNFTSFPSTPSFTTTYYYQTYQNNAGVSALSSNLLHFNIYPNPSADVLHIAESNVTIGTKLTIALFDMQGHLVKQEETIWTGGKDLSLSALSPGSYFLSIGEVSGHALFNTVILKQ
jgi:hypothetical protein